MVAFPVGEADMSATAAARQLADLAPAPAQEPTWDASGISNLVPFQTTGTRPPLFCVHPAGGQVFLYQTFPAHLGPEQPVLAIQSDAVTNGGSEHPSVRAMAAAYADYLEAAQPRGPYRIFGVSFGGAVALALAAEIEERGHSVAYLGVGDVTPIADAIARMQMRMNLFKSELAPKIGSMLAVGAALGALMASLSEAESEAFVAEMLALPLATFRDKVIDRLLALGHLRSRPSAAYLQAQAELSRFHVNLMVRHRDPQIAAHIHVFWPEDGRLSAGRGDWSRYTTGGVTEEVIEGNHLTMWRPPRIGQILEKVARSLARISE